MEPSGDVSFGSVTVLLRGVKRGDDQAIARLWLRFVKRVEGLARRRLFNVEEAQDVANWAFFCFIQKAAKGDIQKLENREDAWSWLAMLTSRECADVLRKRFTIKRGRAVLAQAAAVGEQPFMEINAQNDPVDYREAVAEFDVLLQDFSAALPADRPLRKVLKMLLDGVENTEIADEIGVNVRTVQRYVVEIQKHLQTWMESQRHE